MECLTRSPSLWHRLLGRPASEYGRLCHGDGGHEGGRPCPRALMLAILLDGLGRHVEVARMAGPAGEYYSVTWPGFVGVLTAMAPGRFAATINQAPLKRRTRHPWLRPLDIAINVIATWWSVRHMPPDQLLRQ